MDSEKIKQDGVRLLEEFSEKLREIPETDETHYVVDLKNVDREDSKPILQEGFREKIQKNAPKISEDYFIAEKGV